MNTFSRCLRLFAFAALGTTAAFAQTSQPADASQNQQTQQVPQVAESTQTARPKSTGTSIAIIVDDSAPAKKQFNDLRDGVLAFLNSFGEEDELCLIGVGGKRHLLHELTFDTALIGDTVKKVRSQGEPDFQSALQFAKQQLSSEAENDNAAIVMFIGNEPGVSVSATSARSPSEGKIPVHIIA